MVELKKKIDDRLKSVNWKAELHGKVLQKIIIKLYETFGEPENKSEFFFTTKHTETEGLFKSFDTFINKNSTCQHNYGHQVTGGLLKTACESSSVLVEVDESSIQVAPIQALRSLYFRTQVK